MLRKIFHSTTALCVARVMTRRAEVTLAGALARKPESTDAKLAPDNNVQFLAWFGGPVLAALFAMRKRASVGATSALLAAAGPAMASSYSTFYFGLGFSAAVVTGINAGGSVTGYTFGPASSSSMAWVRTANGTISHFWQGASGTQTAGINRYGVIAGYGCGHSSCPGFMREPGGGIVSFKVKGSYKTQPAGINDRGVIAGSYLNAYEYTSHGFVRGEHGKITSFDPSGTGRYGTYVKAINAGGDITGYYYDSSDTPHGFLRTADGTITSFDVKGMSQTYALAINRHDAIVGYGVDSRGQRIGFERRRDGFIRKFHPRGMVAEGINDKGTITGYMATGDTPYAGFVGSLKSGFTSFNPPDGSGAEPAGINDEGWIAGTYSYHGGDYEYDAFIRKP